MSGPWTATTVEHSGLTFDVHLAGPSDGTPVLLLHGFPQSALSWTGVAERLAAEGLRVIAPDQRGYSPGARPPEVEAYAMPVLADDAVGIARALGHDRVHLVGHDWGAAVAWLAAATRPEAFLSLTALSIPHLAAFNAALRTDAEQQRRSEYFVLFRQEGKAEQVLMAEDATRLRALYQGAVPSDHVEQYVALLRDGALTPALSWYRAMTGEVADLAPVVLPTTYVWGDDDLAVAPAAARACGDHVRADYRFVELPGVGHWTPDAEPEVVAREISLRVAGD